MNRPIRAGSEGIPPGLHSHPRFQALLKKYGGDVER